MAEIIFYEKPGCINNTKQKHLLAFAGHVVIPRNLLAEPWSKEKLQKFFSKMPVEEWFNRTAPRVRDGEIIPERLSADEAVSLMASDPILIRRPLMLIDGTPVVGFDAASLDMDFTLGLESDGADLESCPQNPEHEVGCEVKA